MRVKITQVFLVILLVLSVVSDLCSKTKEQIEATVIQVKDGDTVVVQPVDGGQAFICRLYGIDAPETEKNTKPGQPYGDDAKNYLKRIVLGQTVNVYTTGEKTYNREVCIITKEDKNINLEMVCSGYAWAYRKYLKRPYVSEYIHCEEEARRAKRGLWQQNNPTPPWEWRKVK